MTETLDPAALEKLRDLERRGPSGALRRITEAFLTDAPVKLKMLLAAVAAGDAPAVSMVAHTLRGGCGYVGASRLAELCSVLDGKAEQGDLSDAPRQVCAIEEELKDLRVALEAELPAE